jgi:peptidoglycan hydrolase-like protein with peptidoglycan-binding domain
VCLALAMAGAVTVLAARGFGGRAADAGVHRPAAPATTALVARETLVDEVTVAGRLDYGPSVPVLVPGLGTVTWLAPVGAPVRRGQALVRVDDEPVVLLYGPIPMYRPLTVRTEGADVAQFERNLQALGYGGFDVDEVFTAGTAAAVKRWQRWMGRAATGVVSPGQVIYTPGAIRVDDHRTRLGAPAGTDALAYTSLRKLVTVDAKADGLSWARKGRAVTVALPDGKRVPAAITAIGTTATAPVAAVVPAPPAAGPAVPAATVAVTIAVPDQKGLRSYERSPVEVRFTARERADVLTVPVGALLALAEGGYGLEVVEGATSRIVAVKVGMFTDARVEVSGPGLDEGLRVGIPS